jgi:hypothetical protein
MPLDGTTYRIDKFMVPDAARSEFLTILEATQSVLRQQPGYLGGLVAEQTGGPGRFNLVTVVEWSSGADIDGAKRAVDELHARLGFDRAAFLAQAGIIADLGFYRAFGGAAQTPA